MNVKACQFLPHLNLLYTYHTDVTNRFLSPLKGTQRECLKHTDLEACKVWRCLDTMQATFYAKSA